MAFRPVGIAIVLLLLTIPVAAESAQASEGHTLQLLYTNDVESVYEPLPAVWRSDMKQIGGLAKLASLIHQKRGEKPATVLLDAGDMFTGALSKATQGRLAFDLYNAMGYDAVNLGNHEFEYGWQTLRHVRQRAQFPLLNANIFYADTDIPFGQAYTILRRGDFKIAVLGLMGVDAFENAMMADHRVGLRIEDPVESAARWVPRLRKEADMIVLLTHQGPTAPMQTDKAADPEVQRGFDEEYDLAGAVAGIDIIVAGHTDHGLLSPVRHAKTNTLIVQTFGQGMHLGALNLRWHPNRPLEVISAELIPVNADILPDAAEVNSLIAKARLAYPRLTEVVGRLEGHALRRYYRESVLGNWVADVLRQTAETDVGMITPGALRADLAEGELTVENIRNVFPFMDKVATVSLTGEALLALIEQGLWRAYGLPQYSGLSMTYDLAQPRGRRVQSLQVGGEPVDLARVYTLATGSFTAGGGEGFTQFSGLPAVHSETLLSDTLVAFVMKEKVIQAPKLGRQVPVNK
jgi:5'-nucleotidase/UDP-sugar diphosphatase